MKNGLYIVATPIGNMQDVSARALQVLTEASVIACEDTRMAKKLLGLLGILCQKKFVTLHDHNEAEHAQILSELIAAGNAVALVSDAGSPLISDPGYKLVNLLKKKGVYICTIPGPCALICALQLSGLPTDRFSFLGFIPNKEKARKELFASVKNLPCGTLVFYETANRIEKTLTVAAEVFADSKMAVVREISKLYEECINGTATEILAHFAKAEPKGEMVLLISPKVEEKVLDVEDLLRDELQKNSLKTAVANVVEKYGLNKNEVYQTALRLKNE